jgi:beta-alanine degradation protein BauB
MLQIAFRLIPCAAILTCAIGATEPYPSPSTHRELQFENAHVTVWKTIIMPHQPLKMHRHDCSRVIVALKGGSLTRIEETGEKSELLFDTGKAYWLSEDPPDSLHADVNESDEPIEVMVIEVKSSTK